MFGGGWAEWFIIGIVALIVIGPKDLPVVMRRVGRVVGQVRRMGSEFQRELNKTTGLDQITDLRRSLTEPLRQTSEEIAREFNRITPAGTVEPTGVVPPLDPSKESVYETIAATSGITPAASPTELAPVAAEAPVPAVVTAPIVPEPPPVMKPLAAAPTAVAAPAVAEPPPALAEALAPAAKPKRVSRPRAAKTADAVPEAVAEVAAKPKPAGKPTARKPAAKTAASSEGAAKSTRARARKA